MWKKDAHHKLISHPMSYKIPMMPVNEGESNMMQDFFNDYKHCLHDQGEQLETDKSEMAQQPTYDKFYPSGLTVKWIQHGKKG
eukprot:2405169-Ditylum_brightwellii.AAC.1